MSLIRNHSYVILFFSVILLFTVFTVMSETGKANEMSVVQIEEGDTLWTFAEQFSGSKPNHEWIREIMEENNMQTAKLIAGDTIKIPAEHLKFAPDEHVMYAGDAE